jgi:hypothetical protein
MTDYHTVGGGFDKAREPERIPRKAEGGARDNPVVSRRDYLQGARFAALVSAQPGWEVRLADGRCGGLGLLGRSLRDPKWGLWLGRKSCPPAAPVLVWDETAPEGVFADQGVALRAVLRKLNMSRLAEAKGRLPVLDEATALDAFLHESTQLTPGDRDEVLTLNDVPEAFGAPIGHRHISRRVIRRYPKREALRAPR